MKNFEELSEELVYSILQANLEYTNGDYYSDYCCPFCGFYKKEEELLDVGIRKPTMDDIEHEDVCIYVNAKMLKKIIEKRKTIKEIEKL